MDLEQSRMMLEVRRHLSEVFSKVDRFDTRAGVVPEGRMVILNRVDCS